MQRRPAVLVARLVDAPQRLSVEELLHGMQLARAGGGAKAGGRVVRRADAVRHGFERSGVGLAGAAVGVADELKSRQFKLWALFEKVAGDIPFILRLDLT